jgi:thiol-disulfide isomerase/thioredoxin
MKPLRSFFLSFCIVWSLLGLAQSGKAQSLNSNCPAISGDHLWYGLLSLNDLAVLSFEFRIIQTPALSGAGPDSWAIEIYNADETIHVNEVRATSDSLYFKMPVFDSEFKCRRVRPDSLSGVWINHARKDNNVISFAAWNEKVEPVEKCACSAFAGKWEVDFNPGTPDAYKAIGLFKDPHCADFIYGTFLTETGDYRYLSGYTFLNGGDSMFTLRCFDGSHAFIFRAKKMPDGSLSGDFFSGLQGHEKWVARRNEKFELRNEDSLTFLKPGYDHFDFSFPGTDGKPVSIADVQFKGKVVIVQVMGSWCPNCMDETRFLSGFYDKNKARGLEIIGLAYEKTGEMSRAITNVERLKKRFNCLYPILIASTSNDMEAAAKTLPALNQIMSYPTTLFLDKKGKVRKITTGFNGPATGEYYEKYVEGINAFVDKLLKE